MARSGLLGRFASVAPACCILLQSLSASAQGNPPDKAAAEALFDQGVRLMKQNNFNDACPKLEESDRIDPAVGTLLYLGECYERVGKTASAWATFREAASIANNSNQADRARVASARAQELEPKLSRLSVELAPDVARVPGLVVKRGTQRLEPSLYGTPLPVDPGEYKIEVSAPGYETWTTPIKVEAGGASASVRVPALVKGAEPSGTAPVEPQSGASSGAGGNTASLGTASAASSEGLSTQQTVGVVVGAVGVLGIGAGSYFGIRALSKSSDADPHCPNAGLCNDQEGVTLTNDAKNQAKLSNIAFAAGGVLLGLGAVLYLTGNKSQADHVALVPVLAPGAAGANVVGRF